MKHRLIIQPPASADMDEAYLWIAERAPDSAAKWFNGLEAAIQTLENFPQRRPLAEESKRSMSKSVSLSTGEFVFQNGLAKLVPPISP